MTTRYVGEGGNDGSSGLSWALRKLTLNGVEDTPVVAGDTVYVGPGVYREMLTTHVSGTSGNYISYIGDVTGINTDGVGGIVRITGSDNDTSAARAQCIIESEAGQDYRLFQGFRFDTASTLLLKMNGNNADHKQFIDCVFILSGLTSEILVGSADPAEIIFKRCLLLGGKKYGVAIDMIDTASTGAATDSLVENCVFIGQMEGIRCDYNEFPIKNCTFIGCSRAIKHYGSTGNPVTVTNCHFFSCDSALVGWDTTGDIVENYNNFWSCYTPRSYTATGANSTTTAFLPQTPILYNGVIMGAWWFPMLSQWDTTRALAGSSMSTDDIFGMTRPVTDSKKSWGAIQFTDTERETTTVYDTSAASIKMADAGRHQIWVPVTNTSTTISVRVYREADYAGTNPQLVIKQPGQADDTTTDAAAVSQWNLLTTTLTPSADTDYVVAELVSNNTATSGNYDVFFDSLVVS